MEVYFGRVGGRSNCIVLLSIAISIGIVQLDQSEMDCTDFVCFTHISLKNKLVFVTERGTDRSLLAVYTFR